EPVHPLEALLLRDALVPVDPVLREVEVLGEPLLLLPEVVELGVVEQLDVGPTTFLQCRIRGGAEVLSLRSRGPALGGFLCLHALHPSAPTGWLASFDRRIRRSRRSPSRYRILC